MDFLFHEIYVAVHDKKVPMYASYVMMLIKRKWPIRDDDLSKDCEAHKPAKIHNKAIHLAKVSSASASGPRDAKMK